MMQIWSLALQEFTHATIPLDKQFIYTVHRCFLQSRNCYRTIQTTESAGQKENMGNRVPDLHAQIQQVRF